MRHKYFGFFIVLLCFGLQPKAQTLFDLLSPDPKLDTFYYPFYNGVQMIEIDHLGKWDKEIFYLEQSQPRAIPHSALVPPPPPNEYFFRDKTGVIIKAFNNTTDLNALSSHFRKIPLNKQSTGSGFLLKPTHANSGPLHEGVWVYSTTSSFYFGGFYKVFDMQHPHPKVTPGGLTTYDGSYVGLIDSMGNIRIPMEYQEIFPVGNNLLVCKGDKWGIITKERNVLLALEYDKYQYESQDVITFYKGDKLARTFEIQSARSTALNLSDKIYHLGNAKHHKITMVEKDGKAGFINGDQEEVVSAVYDICEHFQRDKLGLARVFRNNKWGYIDGEGKEIIPCIYEHAEPFGKDSLAFVQLDKETFCINKNQKRVDPCTHIGDWESMGKGILRRRFANKYYYGTFDTLGIVVIPLVYSAIVKEKEYLYKVQLHKKWGYLNQVGEVILPCIYDDISTTEAGFSIVVKNERKGLMNSTFKEIIPCEFEDLRLDQQTNVVFSQNGKYGLMDTLGKVLIPTRYDYLIGFDAAGFSLVRIDSLNGFINMQEQVIVPIKSTELASQFQNGLVWFGENGKYGFYNTKGKIAIPAIYDRVCEFHQKITGVRKGDKWAFIDTRGNKVTDFIYESVGTSTWMAFEYQSVKKDGKWGIIDTKGKEVIPCMYEDIRGGYTEKYGFTVILDGKQIHINNKNKRID